MNLGTGSGQQCAAVVADIYDDSPAGIYIYSMSRNIYIYIHGDRQPVREEGIILNVNEVFADKNFPFIHSSPLIHWTSRGRRRRKVED